MSHQGLSIPQLRAELDGRLVAPGDDGYDRARTVWIGGIDHRPAAIIRARDVADVTRTIALARETGLELAIRGGGHSLVGHGVSDGGITLDLAGLSGLDVSPDRRSAWAGAGLTAGAYTSALGAHGLATGFGDTGSVGIGGITLGGGVGFLSRKHGLTVDQLLAAELVTADGELLRVDADSHPDLFWAIRGGGGNFGVATRFQFQLHEVPTVTGGMLLLPATPETIVGVTAAAEAAPDELSTIAAVMPAPPMPLVPAEHHGKLVIFLLVCYAGPATDGERALAPFRALATPLVDTLAPMSYPDIFEPEDPDFHPTAVIHTQFVDAVDQKVAETILDRLQAIDGSMRMTQLRVLGGAISRVPADATAYAHRARRVMVNISAFYDGPEQRVSRSEWIDDFAAALPQGPGGAYVNFLGEDGPARIRETYPGGAWDRLRAIKRRYDPTNLFRGNHNIPPAD